MEYIRTKEHDTPIDVYFDGEKYVFINRFFGLVAIARRSKMTEFSEDNTEAFTSFTVEATNAISKSTITKVVKKNESTYIPCCVAYKWNVTTDGRNSLPYAVSVRLEKM